MGDTGQDNQRTERFGGDTNNGVSGSDVDYDAQSKRQDAKDARVRTLRSKAAMARSEAEAIAAMHLDPETLEDLLENSSPLEARRLEKSEHAISQRYEKARAAAEAVENDYEQAVLEQYDDTK
jgi:hypothetical protein